jgi:hypothetical protein
MLQPKKTPMKDIDPALLIYAIVGLIIVFATFVVLAIFTEGVKTIHAKSLESEKKKKQEQKNKKAA